MSKVHFFSDDFYFFTGMKESYKGRSIDFTFITGEDTINTMKEKINASSYDDVFIFSFEDDFFLAQALKMDRKKMLNFIFIINTPMSAKNINIGNWLVISKFDDLIGIENAVILQSNFKLTTRDFYFSAREEYVWSLLRGGKSIDEIADHLNLSPKTVYAERGRVVKKISFKRSNELVYLKYGSIFHS